MHRQARILTLAGATLVALLTMDLPGPAQAPLPGRVQVRDDGSVLVGGRSFSSWRDYVTSDFFRRVGSRCGTRPVGVTPFGDPGDCTLGLTDPADLYDPGGDLFEIPVVVHVIQSSSGTGFLSTSRIQSQIDVLNEDFRALPGSAGASGIDTRIEFYLATEDPAGNSTAGITYTTNDLWFNDFGTYYNSLAWDPSRYLNIYTNTASGNLGYVPFFPQEGGAGTNADRVVVLYEAFGINPSFDPFDLGRTTTHEVGHYLGLFHTFAGGCGSAAQCFTTGDLICDTTPQAEPVYGCPGSASSCGSSDNFRNYMDYSDDICFTSFTPQQSRRMRCTLENYRCHLLPACETPDIPDDCAEALSVSDGTTIFNTSGATTDGPDEPSLCSSFGYTHVENDIWFRYDATCSGEVTVSLCQSSYDTKIAIYDGTCPTQSSAMACNDDACDFQSEVTFPSVAGSSYLIRIGGYEGDTGVGEMTISCGGTSVPGEFCAVALDISDGTTFFDTTGAATNGPSEPSICNFFDYTQVGSDVWFRYQATCTGDATVSLCGSSYDTKVAIYEGSCPTGPSAIACNDDACDFQSAVSFPSGFGNTYYVRVGGYLGDQGAGQLAIACEGSGVPFLRGDCDGDGNLNALPDALTALGFGFVPGVPAPPCLAQCDADGNRVFNALADGLYILEFNFVGGPPPPEPYPQCGTEPGDNTVQQLGCEASVCL